MVHGNAEFTKACNSTYYMAPHYAKTTSYRGLRRLFFKFMESKRISELIFLLFVKSLFLTIKLDAILAHPKTILLNNC